MKIIFISIVFFFCNNTGSTQSITFQKVYGIGPREEIGLSVVQTDDDGYMVVGGGYKCLRSDQNGDTLWTGRIPNPGIWIQKTFDNNFVYTSYQNSIVKFDIDGNVLWTRGFYKPSTFTAYIGNSIDQGFILSGGLINGNDIYPYILKADSLGNFMWDQVFNSYPFRTVIKIVQTTDLGYVFTGVDTGAYTMKIDSQGNFLWYKNYKTLMQNSSSIIKLDEGFLICGNDKLLRIDSDGDVIWSKTYSLGVYRETFFYSLVQTYDNGYALTGVRDTTAQIDHAPLVLLLKTDSSGNQSWYKLYGIQNSFNDYNSGKDIRQTNDSGFIITGIIDTNSVYNYNSTNENLFGGELILIKTDKSGDITTGILNSSENITNNYTLYQNYPNPFNPSTKISFSIPKQGLVTLKIYDALGKEVMTLVNETKSRGNYEAVFDGSNLSSGVYFYRLESGEFAETRRMVFLK